MTEADWPEEIRLSPDKTLLTLVFADGSSHALAAEYLRVESPSAEVQGHSPDEKKTIGGKSKVRILALDPVGNYALKIRFDDGHDTGLFTWAYLAELGAKAESLWAAYEAKLKAAGKSREP